MNDDRKIAVRLFVVLLVTGTVISTLGTISLPIADQISSFWPGVVVQALGGIWFGWIGVVVGVLFPHLSGTILGGENLLCWFPSNLSQTILPLLFYRFFKRDPRIRDLRDFFFFVVFVCILPGLAAGCIMPICFGTYAGRPIVYSAYLHDAFRWMTIQAGPLLLIGTPLMVWFSPKVMEANLVAMYWSQESPHRLQRRLAMQTFVAFGLVTVLPLTILGAYQLSTLHGSEVLRPNYLAMALNLTFFSLLIIGARISDVLYRPIRLLTDRLTELSRKYALDASLLECADEETLYSSVVHQIEALLESCRRLERAAATHEVAAQVAHDIRSPLEALKRASVDGHGMPDADRNLIREAILEITDIANSLLSRYSDPQSTSSGRAAARSPDSEAADPEPEMLSLLLETIISRMRFQHRDLPKLRLESCLDSDSYGIFVRADSTTFKRVLSNLLNNAIESLPDSSGVVRVGLTSTKGHACVSITDNGRGIPTDTLVKLGKRGETFGKRGGLGLGLAYAKDSAALWGGNLTLHSTVGQGTVVALILPVATPPKWFVPEVRLTADCPVVVLDDNIEAHHVWESRISSATDGRQEVVPVFNAAGLDEWVRQHPEDALRACYLLDYHLDGCPESGLDLVERLGLAGRAILVTSAYAEARIRQRCQKAGVQLLPKPLAKVVPIRMSSSVVDAVCLDAVLIDDSRALRQLWETVASRLGKSLRTFASPAAFLDVATTIDKTVPVYIDSRLGDSIRGEDFAKELRELGFSRIFLETATAPEKFPVMPWIDGIVGKGAPWDEAASRPKTPAGETQTGENWGLSDRR